MADWSADVYKHVKDADDEAIAGIIRHCGIALRSADASRVSLVDDDEVKRVRESFLKKKLGVTGADVALDAVVREVGHKVDSTRRNRVTLYYLLAEHYDKLSLFRK